MLNGSRLPDSLLPDKGGEVTGAVIRTLFAAVLVVVLAGTACSQEPTGPPPPPAGGPAPVPEHRPLPPDCTRTASTPAQAGVALGQVRAGDVLCLAGPGLRTAELELTTSGTAGRPIRLVGDGSVVRALNVHADHVVIEGLALFDGEGLTLRGRGLAVRDNLLYNAAQHGIVCEQCTDSVIEANRVQRADGTGIVLAGERITVRNNLVSESILRTQGDADGIRFFGSGHRLTGNTIRDIKAAGYEQDPRGGPHTDCFQTYDTATDPLTYDVVISDNVCTNVDVQCLIATAEEDLERRIPPGETAIIFERNTCQVNGAQGVLLQNFPHVIIRDNTFAGPNHRAVMVMWGSTDVVVTGNTVPDGLVPYEVDPRSRPGFTASGNVVR